MLKLTKHENEESTTFVFDGELDISTTELLVEALEQEFEKSLIIFDFSGLQFIDSTGVGCLLFEIKGLQEQGKVIRMENINEDIQLVFDLLGVETVLGEECFVK